MLQWTAFVILITLAVVALALLRPPNSGKNKRIAAIGIVLCLLILAGIIYVTLFAQSRLFFRF